MAAQLSTRPIREIERDLAAARERYRIDGPYQRHVRDCERLYAELQAAKGVANA